MIHLIVASVSSPRTTSNSRACQDTSQAGSWATSTPSQCQSPCDEHSCSSQRFWRSCTVCSITCKDPRRGKILPDQISMWSKAMCFWRSLEILSQELPFTRLVWQRACDSLALRHMSRREPLHNENMCLIMNLGMGPLAYFLVFEALGFQFEPSYWSLSGYDLMTKSADKREAFLRAAPSERLLLETHDCFDWRHLRVQHSNCSAWRLQDEICE